MCNLHGEKVVNFSVILMLAFTVSVLSFVVSFSSHAYGSCLSGRRVDTTLIFRPLYTGAKLTVQSPRCFFFSHIPLLSGNDLLFHLNGLPHLFFAGNGYSQC